MSEKGLEITGEGVEDGVRQVDLKEYFKRVFDDKMALGLLKRKNNDGGVKTVGYKVTRENYHSSSGIIWESDGLRRIERRFPSKWFQICDFELDSEVNSKRNEEKNSSCLWLNDKLSSNVEREFIFFNLDLYLEKFPDTSVVIMPIEGNQAIDTNNWAFSPDLNKKIEGYLSSGRIKYGKSPRASFGWLGGSND